ncbi:hypothetical protein TTHERM_000994239 (macronuclear) [Tetrahymena thermophila SB210]|uniref:Kinase domain protein n=1 Tax=Tetrahymena thermophila (strain SB210) TaxID=312017 RepID=W7WYJ2_TETTS|nr:hypothetical protein TTHERM_000994239 [Tetrahymena thermophila SB210]EWS71940.1 hypothetical protein TTHERM_000994239 [Tetrahymena thermophila SB210]|eukprot:XP_012655526.1 hypothetical protein TTHERM_000994239 [Tetrahymena thermophila SB210]
MSNQVQKYFSTKDFINSNLKMHQNMELIFGLQNLNEVDAAFISDFLSSCTNLIYLKLSIQQFQLITEICQTMIQLYSQEILYHLYKNQYHWRLIQAQMKFKTMVQKVCANFLQNVQIYLIQSQIYSNQNYIQDEGIQYICQSLGLCQNILTLELDLSSNYADNLDNNLQSRKRILKMSRLVNKQIQF